MEWWDWHSGTIRVNCIWVSEHILGFSLMPEVDGGISPSGGSESNSSSIWTSHGDLADGSEAWVSQLLWSGLSNQVEHWESWNLQLRDGTDLGDEGVGVARVNWKVGQLVHQQVRWLQDHCERSPDS